MNLKYAIWLHTQAASQLNDTPARLAELARHLAPSERDDDLWIFDDRSACEQAQQTLERYSVFAETMTLVQLPVDAELTRTFSDYGFTSPSGTSYAYHHLICVFHFIRQAQPAEQAQALLQMDEYMLGRFMHMEHMCYFVDVHHQELMVRIARAYRCEIEVLT